MIKSVTVLKSPLTLSSIGVFMQVPGMVGSQILALGIHSQILTMLVAM